MSTASIWRGVIPAITTPFHADGSIDYDFLARHAQQLIDAGCTGIVPLGSLGEAATLSFEDKLAILRTLTAALKGRAPVIPASPRCRPTRPFAWLRKRRRSAAPA